MDEEEPAGIGQAGLVSISGVVHAQASQVFRRMLDLDLDLG